MLQMDINNHLEKISALESELSASYKSKEVGYDEKTVVMNVEPEGASTDNQKKEGK